MESENKIPLYRLYLFALLEREEYGDKYGDTDDLIKMYEEKLNIKELGNEKKKVKKLG